VGLNAEKNANYFDIGYVNFCLGRNDIIVCFKKKKKRIN